MIGSIIIGIVIGILLNMGADHLPRSADGGPSRMQQRLRWGILPLVSAGLCLYLQRHHGWSANFAMHITYCSLLLLIAVVDLEHRIVPNAILAPGIALALGFNIWLATPGVKAALSGAIVGGGFFLLLAFLRRNALGFGDVKLAFLIGMMTGFPQVLQALAIGIILGGIMAAFLLLTRLRSPRQYMPYAPYLVVGCIVTLLQGPAIANWYARSAGLGG
ncbi:MAG: prepilin peptidase [Chloroflexi bacterium]|nr:prepilin peptidase [Chloroflexota bacterium]